MPRRLSNRKLGVQILIIALIIPVVTERYTFLCIEYHL